MTYVIRNTFPKDSILERKGVKISLCMYMSPVVSKRDKDHVIFKQLIKTIHQGLEALEGNPSELSLIQKVNEMNEEPSWFDHSGKSIVIYIDSLETTLYILSTELQPFSMVSDIFYIRPLISYYKDLQTYMILALEADDFGLFLCDRNHIEKITMDIKTSLHDVFNDQEKQRYVTHGAYGGTNDPSNVHGHGSRNDLKDSMKMKYFSYIDRFILDQYGSDHTYALLLLTSEIHYHDYVTVSKHKKLMPLYIEGSLKIMTLDDILLDVKDIEMKRLKEVTSERLLKYGDLLDSKQSSRDLSVITKEIFDGNIETLLVEKDYNLEGFIDYEKRAYVLNCDSKANHGDIINALISLAISKGSEILICEKKDMKEYQSMLAIFRYRV
jgi:hypothetical protein